MRATRIAVGVFALIGCLFASRWSVADDTGLATIHRIYVNGDGIVSAVLNGGTEACPAGRTISFEAGESVNNLSEKFVDRALSALLTAKVTGTRVAIVISHTDVNRCYGTQIRLE